MLIVKSIWSAACLAWLPMVGFPLIMTWHTAALASTALQHCETGSQASGAPTHSWSEALDQALLGKQTKHWTKQATGRRIRVCQQCNEMRVPTEGGTVDTCWSSGETKFLSSLPVKQSQECLQVIHLLLLCQWGHWDNRGGTFVYHWSFLSNQSLAMHCSQSRNFYKIQKQCLLISNQLWRSERARHQIAQWCTSWKPEQNITHPVSGWLVGWLAVSQGLTGWLRVAVIC